MNKVVLKKRNLIIMFVCALICAFAWKVIPTLAADPIIAPKMVRVKDEVAQSMIYTLPNPNGVETGKYVYSGEVFKLFGVYQTGFCGIVYYNDAGEETVGYCKTTDFEKCTSKLGIDVSHHQGTINWEKVANDTVDKYKVEYAMIKVGQTSKVTSRVAFVDSKFEENIVGAIANSLDTGVYFYSKATTSEQAQAEALWVIDKIKDYSITMPIAFDYEDKSTETLTDGARTEICKAFADTITEAGYTPIIYSCQSYLKSNLQVTELKTDYSFWAARYNKEMPTFTNCDIWQFTDSGSVSGISGNVDMNWWYY